MNEQEIINEFGDMWKMGITKYALIKSEKGYSIMNTLYNSTVIIEDIEVANYVIQELIKNGVRIAEKEEELKNPNRPDPIFYSSEHEAQYRSIMKEKNRNRKK